jgi:hypothetical protein
MLEKLIANALEENLSQFIVGFDAKQLKVGFKGPRAFFPRAQYICRHHSCELIIVSYLMR